MKYDVFISYRREGGDKYARTIQQALEKEYRVFLDFDELKDGVFDQRIIDAISESPVFLLILSKGALDRCVNEHDWVRLEILHAAKCGCHIVPVTIVDDNFDGLPSSLPYDLRRAIGQHQFSELQMKTLFKVSMAQLVNDRIAPYVHREVLNTGTEIHIDVDEDCDLFRFKTFIRHLNAADDNVIYLTPGKYKLEFISTHVVGVKKTMVYSLANDITCDFIEMTLKEEVETAIAKQKSDENAKKNTIWEIIEGIKHNAEERESIKEPLSPIDLDYKEKGWTIIGNGKSVLQKIDLDKIKDDLSFIKISESVIAIEKEAFNYSPSQLIVIPDSVKTIGKDAFNYVPNIVYHGTAQGMPWGAFHVNVFIEDDFIYADKNKKEITGYIGDASLVTIPRKVETIGALSFYYCHYIKTIVIPNSVTRICESAFDGCVNLQEVKCSDSLKHIDWAAFRQCKSLKSIVIPKSIRDIGECAFYGCDNLKTVYLGNPNANYSKNDCPSFPEHTQIIKT